MNRFLRFGILLAVFVLALAGAAALAEEGQPFILTSNFPSFDFVRSVAGDSAQIRMLLPPGSESHSYEPSPQDIIAIQNADLFVYTGGESDHWLEEILLSLGDDAPVCLRMSDSVTLLCTESTDSMDSHHHHDHEHDHDHMHAEEMDEHVWTSPRNVMRIAADIAQALSAVNPSEASLYESRLDAYLKELEALDAAFADIVANGQRDLIVFGDRFPLRYFAAAYGLHYDAAFPGCSEDSEPSVRTVISLIDLVREKQIPVVFYIEFSSRRTVDILAEETGAKPLLFHSCHNVSAEEIAGGATYLSLMRQNAEALKEALN